VLSFRAILQVAGRSHQERRNDISRARPTSALSGTLSDAYGDVDSFERELDQTISEA